MAATQLLESSPQLRPWWLDRRALVLFWLLSALLFGAVAYLTPLERTQEARVLVGAREMVGAGWRDWLIPHVNGRVRIQKPPLAYWLSAASFRIFGVGTFTGRIPMVLATWLTIGLVWCIARRLVNERGAFFAAAALAGALFTMRYGRLAETDIVALPFLTLAAWALWQATVSSQNGWLWYHLSSICIGLAANAKGLPAALPLAFFVGFAWATGRWRAMWDWVTCGAPITLILLAALWWVYVISHLGFATFQLELHRIAAGSGHWGWPWEPIGHMLQATLPWSGFVLLAIVAAATHWRRDQNLRGLLVWSGAILVPLCILPQKQDHYILPILPPLTILAGWLLDRAAGGEDRPLRTATVWVLGATTVGGLACAAGPAIAARVAFGAIRPADAAMSAAVAVGMALLVVLYYRRGLLAALGGAMAVGGVLLATVLGAWAPTMQDRDMAGVAREIGAKFGDGPYAFHPIENMPLSFEMRRVIPTYATAEDVVAAAPKGRLVVISEEDDPVARPPAGMRGVMEFQMNKKVIRVGEVEGGR